MSVAQFKKNEISVRNENIGMVRIIPKMVKKIMGTHIQ
jgi:hypothetical protein